MKKEKKIFVKEIKETKPPAEVVGAPIKKSVNTPQLLRGMKDVLPAEEDYWWLLLDRSRALAKAYGFSRIETSILEEAGLFIRSVGKETDIVDKEMYVFEDLDGSRVALRPEMTASIMRAYLNHGMWNQPQPIKLWYFGPAFRHERPQSGRYRQFHQVGFEILGDASPVVDAEAILIAYNFYKELGVNAVVQLNSLGCPSCREVYRNELVNYYRAHRHQICETCKKRMQRNPLRLLDCKEEMCQPIKKDAPQILDHLCDGCRKHFMSVLEYLDELNIPYLLNHALVRGLDYYTRTVFEVYAVAEDGASQSALGGGGRYDLLSEALGGKPTPACGFSHGLERAISKMKELGLHTPEKRHADVFVAQLGDQARRKAMSLFESFRKSGLRVAEELSRNGLRPQLESADKLGARYALIVGQKEVQDGTAIIRDMESGAQETIDFNKAVSEIQKKMLLNGV